METNDLVPRETAGQITDPSGTIVFDTSSGIPLEEQQEILAGINAMAGGTRIVPEAVVTKASKKGFVFPLFVNIGALVLLGLGFSLLFFLHGHDEQEIRDSSATLGLTERKLIQEIRKETNRQIDEKEKEIDDILSKLSATDAEYRDLQASVETLTEAQQERAAYLSNLQEEYHDTLSALNDEKAKILEDSMESEAALRAQAEEKTKELSSAVEQSQADLGAAMEELRRLGAEQERGARVESQVAGFFTSLNSLIDNGRLDEASSTLASVKEFLASPSLQGLRSFEARKQSYLAAADAMEAAIAEAKRLTEESDRLREGAPVQAQDPGSSELAARDETITELKEKNEALEQRTAGLERDIAAFSSQGSDKDKAIADYAANVGRLETANLNQQQTLNRRDAEIVNLRTESASKDQQVAALNANVAALNGQLQTANSRLAEREATLSGQVQAANSKLAESEATFQGLLQTANSKLAENEAALDAQKNENAAILAEKDELQRQYDDIQQRLDAALKLFQGD